MSLEEDFHQQAIHRRSVQCDLLVAFVFPDFGAGQLQAIQRALARQRLALIPLAPPLGSAFSTSTASSGSCRTWS